MKLKDVAVATGMSISYISDIERGRTVPSIETLAKIAQALNHVLYIGLSESHEHSMPVSDEEEEMIYAVRRRNYEHALMLMLSITGAPQRTLDEGIDITDGEEGVSDGKGQT